MNPPASYPLELVVVVASCFGLCFAKTPDVHMTNCTESDYKFVFTKCDEKQERWRVAIPKMPGQCAGGVVPPPAKGRRCDFSCGAGSFMDMTTQKCRKCAPGMYSLGRGIRYENWHGQLPAGVTVRNVDGDTVLSEMSDELLQQASEVKSGTNQLLKLLADVGEMDSPRERARRRRQNDADDEDFDDDPETLAKKMAGQQMTTTEQALENVNCTGHGWKAVGGLLQAQFPKCSSSLDLVFELDAPGTVEYEYSYPSYASPFIFVVQVQTVACQGHASSSHSYHNAQSTSVDKFRTVKLVLPRGHTTLSFLAVGNKEFSMTEPIKIGRIIVEGAAFAETCTPCPAGYFTADEGTKWCNKCANDTVSEFPGSTSCRKCDTALEYANHEGTKCIKRLPCTAEDYSVVYTECNQGLSSKKYVWRQPKRCNENLPEAVQLPHSRGSVPCPRCNHGMAPVNNNTDAECQYCEGESVGDGNGACKKCPPGSTALRGIHFDWWQESILSSALAVDCTSEIDEYADLCERSEVPWVIAGRFIGLESGFPLQTTATLSVSTEGFTRSGHGEVEFAYEANCPDDSCIFTVSESPAFGSRTLWTLPGGKSNSGVVRLSVDSVYWYKLVWTFLWKPSYKPTPAKTESYALKIFSIHFNNTMDGGGLFCEECWRLGLSSAKGSVKSLAKSSAKDSQEYTFSDDMPVQETMKCVACPDGEYLDSTSHQCTPCPAGTYLSGQSDGVKSCVPCGEGAKSVPGSTHCYTDCVFTDPSTNRQYNFTALSGVHSLSSRPQFTLHAVKYFHNFKLSLCGATFDAACYANSSHKSHSTHNKFVSTMKSKVCRQTNVIIRKGTFHAMPVKLGGHLLSIQTTNDSFGNVSRLPFLPPSLQPAVNQSKDRRNLVTLYFQAKAKDTNCPLGHVSVVTLHCDPDNTDTGVLELGNSSAQCPEGTCDGCSYGFVWHTRAVCPPCTVDDYERFEDACKNGEKKIRFVKLENSSCYGGDMKATNTTTQKCTVLDATVASAVKMYLPFVLVGVGLSVLVILSLIFVVLKNRRLEYKYQRLVQSASAANELPAPEKCVEDDDDEDGEGEESEEVMFSRQRVQASKFMKKLKGFASKGEKVEDFDSIPLTESKA